ncbi:MAG TPA: hypothetical protein VKW09_07465 [bacterium]|nr:hypothetical protein [bacterium]
MTLVPAAAAIAVGYGLAALAVFGGARGWRPRLLAAFATGALAFPVTVFLAGQIQTVLSSAFGWGPDAIAMTLGAGVAAALVTAAVNEAVKLAAALLTWTPSRGGTVAFGAAAGAGFAAVGAYEVIHFALMMRALPISSASGFVGSLVQQLAFVAVNSASTALAAFGVMRHRAAAYLSAAILLQTVFAVFGLLYALRAYSNVAWTILDVVVAAALVAGALILDRRPAADSVLARAA